MYVIKSYNNWYHRSIYKLKNVYTGTWYVTTDVHHLSTVFQYLADYCIDEFVAILVVMQSMDTCSISEVSSESA
jgi:hypothetical protein